MIFQGQEFLEDKWFDDQNPLDWRRAEALEGFVYLYRDLIHLRRNCEGFSKGLTGQHIDLFHVNHEQKVLAYHRWADGGAGDSVVVVLNFSSKPLSDYMIDFPSSGKWTLRFDSHFSGYDASFEGQVSADVDAEETGHQPGYFGRIALAPYSAIIYSQA